MRWNTCFLAMTLVVLGAPIARLGAQVRTQAEIDSLRTDSLRRADSLSRVPKDDTGDFLDAKAKSRQQLPPLPSVGLTRTLPSMSRVVLLRDSIEWGSAETLTDLLMRIPGLVVLRGGSYGRPEVLSYQGRGAAAVEYTVDGVPFGAMGSDSTAVDPTLFALGLIERVEVEQGLGLLRVSLFTRRHDLVLPRTRIGIGSGDQGLGRYSGSFARRYPSGFGVTLAADYFSISAPTNGSGASAIANGMVQFSYFPTPRLGVQYQYLLQAPDRSLLIRNADTLSPQLKGTRSDQQLRLFLGRREDELGLNLNAFLAKTSWSSDSVEQAVGHLGIVAEYRRELWSSEVKLWHHTEWTSFDLTALAGWSPVPQLTGSLEWVIQEHSGDRSTVFGTGRIGARLPRDIMLTGMARSGHRVQSPAFATDIEQRFSDVGVTASLQRPRYGIEVGYTRNDGWQPAPFGQLLRIASLAPLPTTEWATLRGRFALSSWLSLETVYAHPLLGALPGGNPPHHAVTTATVRSKFLHNFPSGIFDLKAQAMAESWSPGIAGLDAGGVGIKMPGRTFYRANLQLQIGPFIVYYDRVNLRGKSASVVPGYPLPALSSTFGVRWAFLN